jgi:gamma-glutamyl-gamma-aminobutyrate hydrolase PuuD
MTHIIAIAPPHGKSELENYTEWLESSGFDYKVLKKDEDPTNYSALILTGGADIGKRPERDKLEFKWFEMCYGTIPILGICRGMQLANIALGGTLYEDLLENDYANHTEDVSLISEEITKETPSVWHSIDIISFSLIIDESYNESFVVNSRHHQGVNEIPDSLNKVAVSSVDGLVEALENENCFLVQWHPERKEVRNKVCSKIVTEWLRFKLRENEISKNRWIEAD